METTTIYLSDMEVDIPAVETTYNTEMSVANSYLSEIAETTTNTSYTVTLLLIFILVAICFVAGLSMARALRR